MGITHFRVYASCGECSQPKSRDLSTRKPDEFAPTAKNMGTCLECRGTDYRWEALAWVKTGYSADVKILLHVAGTTYDHFSRVGPEYLDSREAITFPAGTAAELQVLVDGEGERVPIVIEACEPKPEVREIDLDGDELVFGGGTKICYRKAVADPDPQRAMLSSIAKIEAETRQVRRELGGTICGKIGCGKPAVTNGYAGSLFCWACAEHAKELTGLFGEPLK